MYISTYMHIYVYTYIYTLYTQQFLNTQCMIGLAFKH